MSCYTCEYYSAFAEPRQYNGYVLYGKCFKENKYFPELRPEGINVYVPGGSCKSYKQTKRKEVSYAEGPIGFEPQVMTIEDIWARGDSDPLYLEYRLPKETKLRPAIFQPDNSDRGGGDGYMCVVSAWCGSGFYNIREYGKTWRCWTSRPSDDQREARIWEDYDILMGLGKEDAGK